jgi:choline dehydrogenase-like flavoprotein
MTVLRADACVIGTGAGGAVAAAELAEGGMRVVVLEEGPGRGVADATGRPRDTLPRLYRDGGQVATIGRPPIMLPLGRGTGGTTFVNSGTCFRTPAAVLDAWNEEHGIDGPSEDCFARVERAIGVAEVPPALAGPNAALLRRGAERLGWSGGYLRRNARGCRGSGVCAFGCPTGAKQHAGEVYLPRARAAGATLVTGARAERILIRDGRAAGVEAATASYSAREFAISSVTRPSCTFVVALPPAGTATDASRAPPTGAKPSPENRGCSTVRSLSASTVPVSSAPSASET